MKNIVEIYCLADDLVKLIDKKTEKNKGVGRPSSLSKAEYITIAIMKQEYGIRTNKKTVLLYKKLVHRIFFRICQVMRNLMKA